MTKRIAATAATGAGRRSKRTKITRNAFVWNQCEWKQTTIYTPEVSLMSKISDRCSKVVKKVLAVTPNSADSPLPFELRALAMLPECNRIMRPIHYSASDPDPQHGTAIFEYSPLGDLAQWKDKNFDRKNFKPVPESIIWRFLLQMSQALAVMHNTLGPNRRGREILLHRDIKPKNILVTENGTTYPSFKLFDFDCAAVWTKEKASQTAIVGTFEWQPPENPKVNTKAADIWALGASVHYLATGLYPIDDKVAYEATRFAENNAHPQSAHQYTPVNRYYAARVPRKVTPTNLSRAEQRQQGIAPYTWVAGGPDCYNHQYSDALNGWITQCLHTTPGRRPTAERLVERMSLDAKSMLKKMGGQAALTDLDVIFGPDS
ncbi:kinase-like domain-containing protein [Paraphoma chrysanthemicola]|nr:kinase-like domain-containing protein [Paraphoma chrysanthemicola]